MSSSKDSQPLSDISNAFLALLQAEARFGQQVLSAFGNTSLPNANTVSSAFETAMRQIPGSSTAAAFLKPACHVPPPCWMPRAVGECVSYVSSCNSATVRIVVTNCDRVAHTVQVRSDGPEGVTISPASATLNPMRRESFEATIKIPENTEAGKQLESILWIEGCKQHYLRWTVIVGSASFDSCHEVRVDDCPDYRHHWYDHFYCARPCPNSRTTPNG